MYDPTILDPQAAWQAYEPDDRNPWNRRRAARLLRRLGLGASLDEIDAAVRGSPAATADRLLDTVEPPALAKDVQDLNEAALATNDAHNLAAAWLLRMIRTPAQATEKLTLFWHGHFATSAAKVTDPRMMYEQHQLLRKYAYGPFDELVLAMAQNPAMLIYLDSVTNRRTRPNENFARELMELFCLGLGNYTERDIQQLARCFTGWEVHQGRFHFYAAQHDRGEKEFLGRRGSFSGEEGVKIVVDQPAAARFIARKLFQLYISDEPEPADALVQPLADELRAANWNVKPVIRRIVTSRLALTSAVADRRIQSPVELVVHWSRALGVRLGTQQLATDLASLGQALFYPPNVKGWPGGRAWLNSANIVGRANVLGRIAHEANQRSSHGNLERLAQSQDWRSDEQVVAGFETLLLARPLAEELRGQARQRLAGGSSERAQRIAEMLQIFALAPEVHLA